MSKRSRPLEPFRCLGPILLHAGPFQITCAEIEHCTALALFSGLAVPRNGLLLIFLTTIAIEQTPTEVLLRFGIPLFGGLAEQRDSLFGGLCNAGTG